MPPVGQDLHGDYTDFFRKVNVIWCKGAARCGFSTNEATSPPDTYKRKLPIWLANNPYFNSSLIKGQTALTDYRHGKKETKKEDIPVLTGISSLT